MYRQGPVGLHSRLTITKGQGLNVPSSKDIFGSCMKCSVCPMGLMPLQIPDGFTSMASYAGISDHDLLFSKPAEELKEQLEGPGSIHPPGYRSGEFSFVFPGIVFWPHSLPSTPDKAA